jgi:hypothetical protein
MEGYRNDVPLVKVTAFGGEIIGDRLICNLSEVHLNRFNPLNLTEQKEAFQVAGLMVAVLLNHKFPDAEMQYSRDLDPIVGVSFTGLFDFFVKAFSIQWLQWWQVKRSKSFTGELTPEVKAIAELLNIEVEDYKEEDSYNLGQLFYDIEKTYLNIWKEEAFKGVYNYCDERKLKRPARCTTGQPAGCLSAEALRIMDQGIYYLDEIVEPGSGDSNGLDMSVRNGMVVDKAIANEPKNLVKVTFKNKRTLRMTPDHRLSVNNKWVRADELELGMNIDYSLGQYQKQEDALLIPLNYECYTREYLKENGGRGSGRLTKTITSPTKVNQDIGYFLGCLFGNGYISQGNLPRVRFSFGINRLNIVDRLRKIARTHFGIEGRVDNYGTKVELCFGSTQLVDWLKMNNLHKAEKSAKLDRIPLAIRQSSRETILSFFCGLIDTDGCIRKGGALSIDSASEAFIRNLQQIGEAIGLSFSVFHNNKGKNLQGQKDMWGLCFSRMLSTPEAIQYINEHSIKAQTRPIPLPKKQFNFNPYQIAAVEYETTPDYSFDITVEGKDDNDSWYWQGALKSHNSKSLLTGASSGWHPPKAAWFIRRMTFRREDPIALAAIDYGYNVVPSQSAKDEEGNLLNDPFDPRVDEWLIEVPTRTIWADTPGIEDIDINKFSAISQLDFYMNVQKEYTTHNCFSRDTKFLTSEGVKTFNDYEVGDKVTVLNKDGEWSEATVVNTGDTRPMLKITLERVIYHEYSGYDTKEERVEIISTHCHRFPVRDFYDINEEPTVSTAGTLSEDYLVLDHESYLDPTKGTLWSVVSKEKIEPQVGWCVMEPKTNHFTLENNILVMNTSGTVEFVESEIEQVAKYIYEAIQNDDGYISTALLQRLTASFPRLPFEPISKETYIKLREDVLARRKSNDFYDLLQFYTQLSGMKSSSPQDSACEGIICELGGLPPGEKKG